VSKKNESPNKKRKTVYWRIAIAEQEATAKAVNASLTLGSGQYHFANSWGRSGLRSD